MTEETRKLSGRNRRWIPHPLLTLLLIVIWILLQNAFSVAHLLLGIALGIIFPLMTANFWPDRPNVHNYGKALRYFVLVMGDIVVANIEVARLILFGKVAEFHTCWVRVPLELTSPEAITLFAGTITMTPGTVSCDLSADGRSLLVHCLNEPDPEAAVQLMKSRYEARLLEIFT